MNERIKELYSQAGLTMNNPLAYEQWYLDALEKFAELIVKECANEILKWKSEPFPFDPEFAAKLIKDHFEIK